MTLYLLDTENIGVAWPDYIINKYKQNHNSKFLVFVTEKTASISWHYLVEFRKIRANVFEFCEAHNGEKNALDFCLVARLGEEIARNKNRNFVIVSNDKGFDSAIDYLTQRHGVDITKDCSSGGPDPLSAKQLNNQRREKLVALCGVSAPMAEQLRARLFAEKQSFAPYKNSLEYTLYWIENSHAQSFKQNPELRKKLTEAIAKHYQEIISM